MAAAGDSSSSSRKTRWVVDMEKPRWERHCIYRVPQGTRNLYSKAYQPQVVSLGPFHHGDPNLVSMEQHGIFSTEAGESPLFEKKNKRRAVQHVLQRTNLPFDEFVAAVEDVAEQLQDAYMDLGGEWRASGGRKLFVEMMVVDGCFLLEVMRTVSDGARINEYEINDPIFSHHGVLHTVPFIRRDMLMLENQLPLLLLQRLHAVLSGKPMNDDFFNRMMLRFLDPYSMPMAPGRGLGLHPLDVFRQSMLFGAYPRAVRSSQDNTPESGIPRSAVELYEVGIRFKASKSSSLRDIRFRRGVLSMPTVQVDDSTEYIFLNMMAFERLHVGAGNDVTAFVFFMDNLIDSGKDVALLKSKGIIQNAVGSDVAVANMFNSISRDVVLDADSALDAVQRQLFGYSGLPWAMWGTNLSQTYFKSPWTFLSLVAAVFLLVMTVLQTVFTILQYYQRQ